MANIEKKCPSCAATLTYDPGSASLVCDYCGYSEQVAGFGQGTVQGVGFDNQTIYSLQDYSIINKYNVCKQCGAQIMVSDVQLSNTCPFCGSHSISEVVDSSNSMPPHGIFPFYITKEQARECFFRYVNTCHLVPKNIRDGSALSEFVGVYLPFWSFDTDSVSQYEGKFGTYRGAGDDQYTHYEKRSGILRKRFENYWIIASGRRDLYNVLKRMDKCDITKLEPFREEVLSGFYAERYSVPINEAWDQVRDKFRTEIQNAIVQDVRADTYSYVNFEPVYTNSTVRYFLAPFWITYYTHKGKSYPLLVNGQSGKALTMWPQVSPAWAILIVFAIIFIVFGLIFGLSLLRMLFWFRT